MSQEGFVRQQSDPLVLCYVVADSVGARDVYECLRKASYSAACDILHPAF